MKTIRTIISLLLLLPLVAQAAGKYDNPDTIFVARDGTGEFRTVDEAIEVCRAFMDYHKVIFVKAGTYKEKLIIPQWLQNIEICGEAIIGIANVYKDCGIINWELVRDILCVFGEIMTKCMIRLYNNHMTVIVASDAMDDTMAPGYAYNESLVEAFDIDEYISEDGENNKPTVTVANADSASNQGKSTVKQVAGKGREWLKQMVNKFVGWVTDTIAKVPQKFVDVHKAELDWVEKHDDLNREIAGALGKSFNPHVENWPLYKVPFKALTDNDKSLGNIIKQVDEGRIPANVKSIKEAFYNQYAGENGQPGLDVTGALNAHGASDNKDRNVNGEINVITNYILYGDSHPKATTTNTVTGDNFNDLVSNIKGAQQVMKGFAEKEEKDLRATTETMKKRLNASRSTSSWAEEFFVIDDDEIPVYGNPYMEAVEGEKPAGGGNNSGTGNDASGGGDSTSSQQTPPEQKKDGQQSTENQKPDQNQDENKKKQIEDTSQLEAMFTACQDISRAWGVAGLNAINQTFYRTSYNLYRDMVNAYKQTKGEFQDQANTNNNQPQQPQEPQNNGENGGQES
jgi:hypothetical protein